MWIRVESTSTPLVGLRTCQCRLLYCRPTCVARSRHYCINGYCVATVMDGQQRCFRALASRHSRRRRPVSFAVVNRTYIVVSSQLRRRFHFAAATATFAVHHCSCHVQLFGLESVRWQQGGRTPTVQPFRVGAGCCCLRPPKSQQCAFTSAPQPVALNTLFQQYQPAAAARHRQPTGGKAAARLWNAIVSS